MTVALAAPLNVTVVPGPFVVDPMIPEILYVTAVAVKFTAVTLALLIVTG